MVTVLDHSFTFSVTLVFIRNQGDQPFCYILTEEYEDLLGDDMPTITPLSDGLESQDQVSLWLVFNLIVFPHNLHIDFNFR